MNSAQNVTGTKFWIARWGEVIVGTRYINAGGKILHLSGPLHLVFESSGVFMNSSNAEFNSAQNATGTKFWIARWA